MESLFADVGRKRDRDADDDDDEEHDDGDADADDDGKADEVDKPPFVIDGPWAPWPLKPPLEHSGQDWDLLTGSMWSVPVSKLTSEDIRTHIQALTCQPNKDKKQPLCRGPPKTFPIGGVSSGRLFMPPWYARQAFPQATKTRTTYTRGEPMRDGISFSGELYGHPPQKQAAARLHEFFSGHRDCMACIISLPCGYGKTVLLLWLALSMKRVTLILTHKLPLLSQWVKETRGFLHGARVGYVSSDGVRVEGVDVIVASMQSLLSHLGQWEKEKAGGVPETASAVPHIPILLRRVGFVCMDEGHHAIASTFSKVFSSIPARYRIVLTATPRRKDGLMPQLQWVAGPVIFRAFRQVGEVHVVSVKYENPDLVEKRTRKGDLLLEDMVTTLTEDPARTALAVSLIMAQVALGRRVLVVTPRVDHVKEVGDRVEECLVRGGGTGGTLPGPRTVPMFEEEPKPKNRRRKPGEDPALVAAANKAALHEWEDTGPHGSIKPYTAPLVGRILQGMKTFDRDLAYEAHVVVATSDMMEEGISYKQWDTLVDLDNLGDVEQVAGRIFRACPTKKVPLVIDVWIALSAFQGLYYKRKKYYRDEGFNLYNVTASGPEDAPGPEFWEQFDRPAPAVM